jgi:hypothetical protein
MKTQKPKRNEWIDFNIYPEQEGVKAMAKAKINDKNELSIKLSFTAQRGFYYSFLEDARIEAHKLFCKYYKITA